MQRRLLVLLIFLGFALRLHELDAMGFWQDEGLTPLRAGYSVPEILSNQIIIQEGITKDTHPPLYYLIIHYSRLLLGESDFAYRFPSAIAGALLIPLLYQFGRGLYNDKTGLLAATLATINPLQIWYSQEARMYTLTVLLATLATYALWRAFCSRRLVGWFLLYLVGAGLAFLTHYTAAILIAGQAPFWVWLLWRRGQRRLIIGGAIAGLLLLIPFIPVTVPRLFTGAETNYTYVSPLIMLQDIVHGFGMGMTVDFSRLSIKLLDVGVLLVLLAGIFGPWKGTREGQDGERLTPDKGWLPRLFLLDYLLVVLLGLALGSLIKPMYQGARHMIVGSPAFFLLLALGIQTLRQRSHFAAYAAVPFVILGPAIALGNLYYNPEYAKDDTRALIRAIESRAGGRDAVIYNNAILLPLHWHYQQRDDLMVTALPVYPNPANEETVAQLEALSEAYDRLWFVTDPPADKRDEGQLVRGWLDEHLLQIDRHNEHARTILVQSLAYDTAPWQLTALPENSVRADFQWPGTPNLFGWQPDFSQPAGLPTLWLDLFWQGDGQPPADGRQLRLALRGQDGWLWQDENQPFWLKDPGPLFGAPLVRLSYGLPVPAGTPPGDYELLLLSWDAATGEAGGDWSTLGTVSLAAADSWPLPAHIPSEDRAALTFANGMHLVGLDASTAEVRPGHALPLSIFWRGDHLPGDLRYQLEVLGPDERVWISHQSSPGPEWLTEDSWPAGALVREQIGLLFPADAPPGRYRLRWRMLQGDEVIPVRPAWRPWSTEGLTYGQIQVEPWPLETSLPDLANPLEAHFGQEIQLYGYDLAETSLQPGGSLDLTLYWQALDVPTEDYNVFVHLISAADGEIVSQQDGVPVDWLRPTKGWRKDEVLVDNYQLSLPADLTPGTYELYVGLFDPESFERAPVTVEGQAQPDGRLLLTTMTVP
jgi:4-amino-4-deoxy-L-arabinose transferase-like glycosyltransferase